MESIVINGIMLAVVVFVLLGIGALVLSLPKGGRKGRPVPRAAVHTERHDDHAHSKTDAHDDHEHDGHGGSSPFAMNFKLSGMTKWIVAGVLFAFAVAVLIVGIIFQDGSPSPGSIAYFLRHNWLWFIVGGFLLFVAVSVLGGIGKPIRGAFMCIATFLVVLGLFGPMLDGVKPQGSARAGRGTVQVPTRAPNPEGQWSVFTAPADGTIHWILTPKGYRVNICDPGISPNCDPTDPSAWRYQRYCRVNGEVFTRESGKCVMTEAVGVQSKTGAPLTLASLDVPLGTQTALEQPAAEPEPSIESAAEAEQSAPIAEPEPAAPQPQSPVRKATVEDVYGMPMDSYRQSY